MESRDVIVDALDRVRENLHLSLDGLTAEQLAFRPGEQSNTIAWLAWHLTRVQDHHLSDLAGRPQAWVEEGWHQKFGRPADPGDIGHGATPEQVASIRPTSPTLLESYYDAAHDRSVAYVQTLSSADLDRVLNEPRWNPPPTLGVRLVSVCADNLQHVGQMAYLRGLVENRHWYRA